MGAILILWLLMGVTSGLIAANKGRNGFGFGVLGVLLGPIGIIAAALANPILKQPLGHLEKRCPECAELVQAAAKVCRYCGHRFLSDDDSTAVELAVKPEPTLIQKLWWNPHGGN